MDPESEILTIFDRYWVAIATIAAANLGVADLIGSQPREIVEIAQSIPAHTDSLYRLMRSLSSVGIFREGPDRHFVNTRLSATLRSDAPGGCRAIIQMFGLKSTREAVAEYECAIRTGESAFQFSHGVHGHFRVLDQRPEEAAAYHAGMTMLTERFSVLAELCDFSGINKLVDIGGGHGTFIAQVLRRNPGQRGVLFDLPNVVTHAKPIFKRYGVADRCEIHAGDFQKDVPANGDGYVLKNILHGWHRSSVDLLRRIRKSGGAKAHVFVIENLLPAGNAPSPSKLFDLFLLLGGSEAGVRTEFDFRSLFAQAGFDVVRLSPILGDICLIEGRVSD